MNEDHLRHTIALAVSIDREIAEKTEILKRLKRELIIEAGLRPDEHTNTSGGGRSWTAEGRDGCIARVTFPAPKLRSTIAGEGAAIEKIRALAASHFASLFAQVPAYKPADDFRTLAQNRLGKDAKKLIRACESASSPTVSFETKE